MKTTRPPVFWTGILAVVLVKLAIHLYSNPHYGFHRDELLYLALGDHPSWGHWSVPPFIGWAGFLIKNTLGDALWAVRLLPTLGGGALLIITALIAREFGAKRWGQFLAALAILVSPAYLRTSVLFQPVIFDVCFWALASYLIIRYLNYEKDTTLLWLGAILGLGLLTKYMMGFFIMALIIGMLLTPQRKLLTNRMFWMAVLLTGLIVLPNILWQIAYQFPVVTHMRQLNTSQLVNVQPADFLTEQLLFNLPALFIWLPGVVWLFTHPKYRIGGWVFVFTILILLLLRGKSYYTLGIYPLVIGAGSAFWSQTYQKLWFRIAMPVFMVLLIAPLVPVGLPILKAPAMIKYGKWAGENLGLDFLTRWEDGRQYPLPQDYADMLGWEELGDLITQAYRQVPAGEDVMIFCENYGQAGAAMRFAVPQGTPEPVSFNGTFAIWAPLETNASALIYVNDELGEDIAELFADIQEIGRIQNPYARERGTQVYLCREPRADVGQFWSSRVREVKREMGVLKE